MRVTQKEISERTERFLDERHWNLPDIIGSVMWTENIDYSSRLRSDEI